MPKLRTTQLPLLILYISVANVKIIAGYSQIALSGSGGSSEGPKLYKAMNVDLIFPKTFNTSENVISTTTDQKPTITQPSTWPSNHKPAIFVTPARQEDFMLTTASPPWPTSSATESHVVAESYALPSNQQDVEQLEAMQQEQQQHENDAKQQQLQVIQQQRQQQHQQQQTYESTGRAVDYRTTYPFGQLITPLINKAQPPPRPGITSSYGGRQQLRPAVQQAQSGVGKLVYPSGYTRQRVPLKAQISDRFSPSEGVASHQFKNHQHHHAPSNQVSSYVPPKNLYSFPPNINAKYPSPSDDPTASLPTNSVNSYLAPASGPLVNSGGYPTASNGGYVYSGPINPNYMAPAAPPDTQKPSEDTKDADHSAADNDDDTIGVLPASAMDADGASDGSDAMDADAMHGDTMNMMNVGDSSDHDHPPAGYDADKEYPTPPPGWLEKHPEATKDPPHDHAPPHHDHIEYDDHHHDHFPSYPIYKHHYPEIIYDDHHYHHHHPPPETTTLPPPPEPSPEPRVKKYSYFYIGRKLWYIPLYFTVWFSFYVLWLIVKSIARHKVNLPNHYVTRRSLPNFTEQQTHEYINQLTVSVLEQIDKFKEQYLK